MDPFDAREYLVDAEPTPRAVRAGEQFRLQLTVREPVSRAVVREFATVHDKRFHLFVISQDLEHYAHVHPDQQPDGSWGIDVTLPRPGYYKLYCDFLPMGGHAASDCRAARDGRVPRRPRFIRSRSRPRSRRSPSRPETCASSWSFPTPRSWLVGKEMFAFHLTDARTGTPVADIEPVPRSVGSCPPYQWGHAGGGSRASRGARSG